MKPKIGITIGDLAGIGYEIIQKSIPQVADFCEPIIIGKVLSNIKYGKVNAEYGKIAGEAITEAVQMVIDGKIDAIVTAPINKEALNLGGFKYAGHTEMLAHLTNTKNYAMMLVHKNLRVAHVTTHIPLNQIFFHISTERIVETIEIANDTCKKLGIEQPYIAVCGLNPHSSDGGLFGDEENLVIQPAIDQAILKGINCEVYPVPSDVVFAKALGGKYDCIIAMYHDQGHIPIKTVGFKWNGLGWGEVDGVNITCGLPIIRTSPDHGVAYGKAGKGTASPLSMISAIRIANELVKNRRLNEKEIRR